MIVKSIQMKILLVSQYIWDLIEKVYKEPQNKAALMDQQKGEFSWFEKERQYRWVKVHLRKWWVHLHPKKLGRSCTIIAKGWRKSRGSTPNTKRWVWIIIYGGELIHLILLYKSLSDDKSTKEEW